MGTNPATIKYPQPSFCTLAILELLCLWIKTRHAPHLTTRTNLNVAEGLIDHLDSLGHDMETPAGHGLFHQYP